MHSKKHLDFLDDVARAGDLALGTEVFLAHLAVTARALLDQLRLWQLMAMKEGGEM